MTKTVNPKDVDQCIEDFKKMRGSGGDVSPQALVGYAFWWIEKDRKTPNEKE